MAFEDRSLQCCDCGVTFTFTASEQESFASRGFTHDPKRCPACRQARRAQRNGNERYSYPPRRQMFPAVCARCGKDCEVPFQPREGRPVYCSECYSAISVKR